MKRTYKLPIIGKVVKREPLEGKADSPICVIPLNELPDQPTYIDSFTGQEVKYPISYICLNYDIDEGWCEIELEANDIVHNWLLALIPQLRHIAEAKGWKLDKTELEKGG